MKHASILIKTVLTAGILFFLIYSTGPEKIIDSFRQIDKSYLFKAIALAPLIMLLGSFKWYVLLRGHGLDVSYFQAFKSFFFGMGIGIFTPGKAGEFARIFLIPQGSKLNLAALVLYDRLIDLSVVILLAMFSAFYFMGTLAGFIYMGGVLIVVFFLTERRILFGTCRHILQKIPPLAPLVKEPSAIIQLGLNTVSICFLTRLALSFIDLFQLYFLIQAFHPINMAEVLLCYPPILLVSVLPFTFSGLGIREGFSSRILSRFGIPDVAGINSTFLLFCINTLFPGMLGVIFAYNLNIPFSKKQIHDNRKL